MKYLDVFLSSSSDELKNDRAELVNYIRNLNDTIYEKRNIKIRMHSLKFLNESLDSWIEDSDYFYVLMQRVGDEKAAERKTKVDLKFQDGKLYINDVEFNEIDLKNIPSYINNNNLKQLREKIEAAQKAFQKTKTESEKLQASKVWNESLKEMNEFENELCQISFELSQMMSDPNNTSALLKEAIQEFEQGNLDTALSLLDDENRHIQLKMIQKTKQNSLETIEKCDQELQNLNEEALTKIKMLQSEKGELETEKKVIALHEEVKQRNLVNHFDLKSE